jgi:hypothetical protein
MAARAFLTLLAMGSLVASALLAGMLGIASMASSDNRECNAKRRPREVGG